MLCVRQLQQRQSLRQWQAGMRIEMLVPT
jgi:hypothetical protein